MPKSKFDLKLKNIVFQHAVVIIIGVGIFYIDEIEFLDKFYPKFFLLIAALSKSFYFMGHSFKKIEEASTYNLTYNRFMVVIMTNIFLIIISFTVDFSCLFQFDQLSFMGVAKDSSILSILFDFFYFSVLTFTTTGFGDIVPLTKSAKFLVTLEVVVSFITTIIVISNFVHVKDSINDLKFLKIRKKASTEKEVGEVDLKEKEII